MLTNRITSGIGKKNIKVDVGERDEVEGVPIVSLSQFPDIKFIRVICFGRTSLSFSSSFGLHFSPLGYFTSDLF